MTELQSEDSDKTPVNATIACKNRRGKFITSKKGKPFPKIKTVSNEKK